MWIEGTELNRFDIITDKDTTSITAGQELRDYLDKYCDYQPSACGNVEGKIYIGFPSIEDFSLPIDELQNADSFVIKTSPKRLYICGKTPEGTLYGVYHFLNMLGIDWLTAKQEIAEVNNEQNIQCDIVYNFTSQIRQAFGYGANYADKKFFIRQRLKRTVGETNNQPFFGDIHGVEYAFGWGMFGHTFDWFIPYDEYFETHPEYFSFDKRHYGEKGKSQICLTNPEVIEIVKKKTLDYLETHPTCKIVSVSQNDAYEDFIDNLCMCDSCRAIYEREGNRYSGVLISFVNQIADAVAEKYPDVLIHTFGYKQTTTPPLYIKPRKNVLVQVCLSHQPHWTLLSNKEDCIRCKKQFDDWKAVCEKVHVWTYLVNHAFYFTPIANLQSLYVDTTYMLRAGVYGIFQQENDDDFPFEFSDLRIYLIAKLFQNPYISYEEYLGYVKKFLKGYYGKQSGEYIYDYLHGLENLYEQEKEQKELSQKGYEMLSSVDSVFNNKTFIEQSKDLWKKALFYSESEIYRKRIEDSKKSFDFTELVYLYANIRSEQDLQIYAEKKERLYKYACAHKGFLIYGESWARRVQDLSKIDWKTSPRILRNIDKEIKLRGTEKSEKQYSEANTNESFTDFYFNFDVRNTGERLDFHIEVTDKNCTHVKKLDDWEQDSVELFFSESFHKQNATREGDFRVLINAQGDWNANGKENRVTVSSYKTESGYAIDVSVAFEKGLLLVGKKIGFEIIAHNIGDEGYLNTVYWNSQKRAIMNYYPSLCGEIQFL